MDATSTPYHTIPMHIDSVRSSLYAAGVLTLGGSNYQGRDNLYAFSPSIYRSHNFGNFQAYYGAGLTLGDYAVGQYDGIIYGRFRGQPDTVLRIASKNYLFGGLGFQGGLNYVIPLGSKTEWRVLGLETSWQREFGSYLSFRRSLHDSVTNILATYQWTRIVGLSTEFVSKTRRGKEVGYKMAYGQSLVSADTYVGDSSNIKPFYFSNTFHITSNRTTFFLQLNVGRKSNNIQTGVSVRLAGGAHR